LENTDKRKIRPVQGGGYIGIHPVSVKFFVCDEHEWGISYLWYAEEFQALRIAD
jgi:hypothetical protein